MNQRLLPIRRQLADRDAGKPLQRQIEVPALHSGAHNMARMVALKHDGESRGLWLIAGEVRVLDYSAREREFGALKVVSAK
jgi:hypothetical protein